jgi:hypothetical protein
MTTIQIQDALHSTRSHEASPSPGVAHGIYSMRNRSQTSVNLHRSRSRSLSRAATERRSVDVEDGAGLRQEGDFKQKQVYALNRL